MWKNNDDEWMEYGRVDDGQCVTMHHHNSTLKISEESKFILSEV